jgi:predicted GNAT superfamily acetyltransferase
MPSPRYLPPEVTAGWSLRPFVGEDRAALLRLNADNYPAVHPLDETTLDWLLAFGGGHHWVAQDRTGAVLGYLLSFASASNYDDPEIRELRRRMAEPFFYICQVVVAPAHRERGIASAFYRMVATTARSQGVRFLCCDVNTNPPNPDSMAFHRCLGFAEVGAGTASNGFAITFLALQF